MMGNLSSRRKSILWKTDNFPAKGRIISLRSSVSFEKAVVKVEDRREVGRQCFKQQKKKKDLYSALKDRKHMD